MSDHSNDSDEEEVVKAEDDESESDEESDHEFSDPEGFVDDITDEGKIEVGIFNEVLTSLLAFVFVDRAPSWFTERQASRGHEFEYGDSRWQCAENRPRENGQTQVSAEQGVWEVRKD